MRFYASFTLMAATLASAVVLPRAEITEFDESPVEFYFPAGRAGYTPAKAGDAPCGGAPAGERTKFPLSGGRLSITQRTAVDNMNILWTKGEPTRFHQFATYTNTITDISEGHYCAPGPDFESLGLSEGDDATLLVIYALDGQKGMYYHCADVSLVAQSSFTEPENLMCGNHTKDIQVAASEDSMHLNGTEGAHGGESPHGDKYKASSSSSDSDGNGNKLSNAAAGGIGAGVTLGVVLLLAAALLALGRLHFGHRKVHLNDTASTSSASSLQQKTSR